MTCDLCKGGKVVCVNICCPHGDVFKPTTTTEEGYACLAEADREYEPRFYDWSGQEVQYHQNTDYLLTAPRPQEGPLPKLYKEGSLILISNQNLSRR